MASLLLGGFLVILCGIAISHLARSTIDFGKQRSQTEKAINADYTELNQLIGKVDWAKESWLQRVALFVDHEDLISHLSKKSSSHGGRIRELKDRREALKQYLRDSSDGISLYKTRVRLKARTEVVGEEIEQFELADGRTYHQVRIGSVDTFGIGIQHRGGLARISFKELPDSWKARLHWSPSEEKPARPIPEPDSAAPKKVSEPNQNHRKKETTPSTRKNESAIHKAQQRFLGTRRAYLNAKHEAVSARSSVNSSQQSIPGSLETWEERALSLERYAKKLHIAHLRARRGLELVSPNDSLLRDRQ